MRIIRDAAALLGSRERKAALGVFVLMLASAALEVLGVASVMPFIAVLATPEVISSNPLLQSAFQWLGSADERHFMILLGVLALSLFLLSLGVKALSTYTILRYSQMCAFRFSYDLLERYLSQPYEFFLHRNSADLSRILFSEVNEVVNGVVMPILKIVSSGLVVFCIMLLLIAVDPITTLVVCIVLGGSFIFVYVLSREALGKLGSQRIKDNSARFILASEALAGVKELRLMGRERTYLDRFKEVAYRFARLQSASKAIGDLPHFAVQGIAFGGVLVLVLLLTGRYGSLASAMPIVALYAFAGYRLLPALQQLFKNGTQLRYYRDTLATLRADLTRPTMHQVAEFTPEVEPRLAGTIQFDNVSYSYPESAAKVLSQLSIKIPKGATAAFVGSTGAGKSTAVDLIMGLLAPQEGKILIGDTVLNDTNLRSWQRNIGYVPQSIFLADVSVSKNIAFGVPYDSINMKAVEAAARLAHIHDFVVDKLPDGYSTPVGERGARLSGGQRQRIGIARALYHDPEILIFDEATSALDNATESAIMDAVNELAGRKTIIMIAHRLSTIQNCDIIYMLKDGQLIGQGTFSELSSACAEFAELAVKNI